MHKMQETSSLPVQIILFMSYNYSYYKTEGGLYVDTDMKTGRRIGKRIEISGNGTSRRRELKQFVTEWNRF